MMYAVYISGGFRIGKLVISNYKLASIDIGFLSFHQIFHSGSPP